MRVIGDGHFGRKAPDRMNMWKSKPFVVFFGAVAAVSLLFLFLSWRTVTHYDCLLHNGTRTQGQVVDNYVRRGSRGYGQNNYYVYRFLDAQARPHESQVVRSEPDHRLAVGQDLEILYDPRDPNRSMPSTMVPDNIYRPVYASLTFMAVALAVTLAFGAVVFSRFAPTKLRWPPLKRFSGTPDCGPAPDRPSSAFRTRSP